MIKPGKKEAVYFAEGFQTVRQAKFDLSYQTVNL
jgi:hypothetical protein